MFNPFRDFSPHIHSSTTVYAPRSRKTSGRKKGFFQRLIDLTDRSRNVDLGRISVDLEAEIAEISEVNLEAKILAAEVLEAETLEAKSVDFNIIQAEQPSLSKLSEDVEKEITVDLQLCLKNGHRLLQQGDFASAAAHYRQVIAHDSNSVEAYQCLAEALTQQNQLEEAAYCYRQAIALTDQALTDQTLTNSSASIITGASNVVELPTKPSTDEQFQQLTEQFTEPANNANKQIDAQCNDKTNAKTSAQIDHQTNEQVDAKGNARKSRRNRAKNISSFEKASFHLQQAMVNCNAGDWEEAHTACQLALTQLEPETANAYLILGRALQGKGQPTEAEQAFHKALMLRPNSAEAHARLGSLYTEQNRLVDAAQQYQTAIQLDATFAGAYWKLAEVWQQLGEESKAVSCWYQAFQLQPTWADATEYCQLAGRLLNLGELTAAQEYYARAIRLNSSLAEAYLGMGRVLSHQGQTQAAIRYYQKILQQNLSDANLYIELGDALTQLEQWQDALICYQRLIQLVPDHAAAVAGIQKCYMQLEQWQDALTYSRMRVALEPDFYQSWHQLGDVFSRLDRWQDAVAAYQQAIELEPNFSWSHNNLGDALLRLESWQQAATAFQNAVSLNPTFAWSHYNLGEALSHLQDWDGAIEAYRQALKQQPDLPYVTGRLADALQQRSQADRAGAVAFYQQAIQQNPLEPENYHKLLELQPNTVELYLGLSDALLAKDRLDEAFVCCQIARQLRPDDAEINAKLEQLLQQRTLIKRPKADNNAAYDRWLQKHTPTTADLQQMAKTAKTFAYQPLISILMPVYNTPIPFLKAAIQSVLEQVYPHWELCIADDASSKPDVREILDEYAAQDSRIKVVYRHKNGHIAAASNSALAEATGDYIALLDHDDRLAPEALYEVVSLLNQHPEADMIYSDEDKLNEQEQRVQPFFKPEWCPDSFLSRMYTCHLGVYRRRLVQQVGSFRLGYEGSQDYDLVLRLTEQTNRIFHIPKVLYHWRIHDASTASGQAQKSYSKEAAKQALADACERRGEPIQAVATNPAFPGVYVVRYKITEYKPVSIIIPTRDLGDILDRCLQSIFEKSTYPNYEVVLIDNGSEDIETLTIITEWQQREPERFSCYPLDIPFNYSTINNIAVSKARGDYLLFLNNDVEVITPDWIEAMVEQVQRPSIGAVGSLLLYPDHTVQHAGVVLGIGGVAGHSHKYFPINHPGYFSQLVSVNNYSAVTAACLMCRRTVFEQAGGFDESLAVAFNDVDLCLKIKQLGYENVYLPHVVLYHHESKSRGIEDTLQKQRRFRQEIEVIQRKWEDLLEQDPCYSLHLTRDREDFSLKLI